MGLMLLCGQWAVTALRTSGFATVKGVVISSHVKSTEVGAINLHDPVIEYAYVVQGRRYRNNVYVPTDSSGKRKWATTVVAQYPPKSPCTVYYDPAEPQNSVLSTKLTSGAIWTIALCVPLGLLFFLNGVFVLMIHRRNR
ncbi:MAG: DUF3592 domain-containing protein [Candidatus Nealsonbacteria bacterium]|nr:DUF3592 domain-containing protein [Candidatus Nealsonbacteria bacterium]